MSRRDELIRVQQDIFDTFFEPIKPDTEVAIYDTYTECQACKGTGMGRADGSPCQHCRGTGNSKPKIERDYGD